MPHFVLQLVGEYVIEIARVALDNIDAIPAARYHAFATENERFMAVIRARVVSYFEAYVRPSALVSYPGHQFLSSLGLWVGPEARRRIRRETARNDPSPD